MAQKQNFSQTVRIGNANPGGGGLPLSNRGFSPSTQTIRQSSFFDDSLTVKIGINDMYKEAANKILSSTYDSLQRSFASNQMLLMNQKIENASQEFLNKNKTGAGYAKYMRDVYNKEKLNAVITSPDVKTQELVNTQANFAVIQGVNTAKAKEISISGKFVQDTVNDNTNKLKQIAYNNPENFGQIKLQYLSTLNAMKPFLKDDYPKYEREQLNEFSKCTIQGLIKKYPNKALETLRSNEVIADLDADDRRALINTAINEVNVINAQKRAEQNEIKARLEEREAINAQKCLNAIHMGQITTEEEIRTYNFSELKTQQLIGTLISTHYQNKEANEEYSRLKYNVSQGLPSNNISEKTANLYYRNMKQSLDKQRESAGGESITLVEETDLVQAMKVGVRIKDIEDKITTYIANGTPKQALEGAIALQKLSDFNSNTIKGIDDKTRIAAQTIIQESVTGSNSVENLPLIVEKSRKIFDSQINEQVLRDREEVVNRAINDYKSNKFDIGVAELINRSGSGWNISLGETTGGTTLGIRTKKTSIPSLMRVVLEREAEEGFRNLVLNGANPGLARNINRERLEKKYNYSSVVRKDGEKMFMKSPPENYYQHIPVEDLRKEYLKDVELIDMKLQKEYGVDYIPSKEGKIRIPIDGVLESRTVFLEPIKDNDGYYTAYYFLDEKSMSGPVTIYLEGSYNPLVINFEGIQVNK